MMVTEYAQAQTDLKMLGNSVNMTIADSIDAEHQALMQRLQSLSGYSFDTAYMNSQLKDHQKTLTIFQTEISSGQHQQVCSYAGTYLPHIQMHYSKADSIRKSMP